MTKEKHRESLSAAPPFAEPSEADEFEYTTAGRMPCASCGEYIYPQRPIGLQSGYAFPANCPVCGAVTHV